MFQILKKIYFRLNNSEYKLQKLYFLLYNLKYKSCIMDCRIQNTKENLYFRLYNREYKQSRKDTFGILKNMGVHE